MLVRKDGNRVLRVSALGGPSGFRELWLGGPFPPKAYSDYPMQESHPRNMSGCKPGNMAPLLGFAGQREWTLTTRDRLPARPQTLATVPGREAILLTSQFGITP
jgi:hypothetical protein